MYEEISKTEQQLIYLISCALHNVVPECAYIEDLELGKLYDLAKRNSLRAMVCMVLEKTDLFNAPETSDISKKFIEAKNKAIRKNMLMDAERAQIYSEMDEAGIWHVSLKGIIIKDLYPQYGMREMSDNDILYDASHQEVLRKIMIGRGYKDVEVGKGNHDIYEKPPIYNFEMHTALFNSLHPEWNEFFSDIDSRMLKTKKNGYEFAFSANDFYVHTATHAAKHFECKGTGLRTLIDIYVVNCAMGNLIDREYVDGVLASLNVGTIEKEARSISEKLFREVDYSAINKLTGKERRMLGYCVKSGVYGTAANGVRREMGAVETDKITMMAKTKYCLTRIFPGAEWCRGRYPFFAKHPLALPGLWIYRIVKVLFFGKKRIMNEVKVVAKTK